MSAKCFSLVLTQAQRKAVVTFLPYFADRLTVEEKASRTIAFSLNELEQVAVACKIAQHHMTGMLRNSLRHVMEAAEKTLEKYYQSSISRIPVTERLYQFKITLKEVAPPIWRRIRVKDSTLDKLHERIQTAMGWTNSHLHRFTINGITHGDPQLLYDGWQDEVLPVDSLVTRISDILPADGTPFSFDYEYDFGDSWQHEILFEGCLRAEKGVRYPLCVEGERACPPEDVGGSYGYQDFLEALADPDHEGHESALEWAGRFKADKFSAKTATRRMKQGIFDWRSAAEEGLL
jgi:hypothetical protein